MMRRLRTDDESFQPADQLALDEALLGGAEAGDVPPVVRTWFFHRAVVVLGRSSKFAVETNAEFCQRHDVPILRRCSGGAAVLGGPGCLMYSVVIPNSVDGGIAGVDAAHNYAMTRVLSAVRRQLPVAQRQGICDLTWNDRKFSGNSLRITRGHILYHGTVLFDADLDFVDRCLADAPRQPEYRRGRPHRGFITNIDIDPDRFSNDLADQFDAPPHRILSMSQMPAALRVEMDRLMANRYGQPQWHQRH